MNLKAEKFFYLIVLFFYCSSIHTCYREEACLKKGSQYNYHRYPCRLPECSAGFEEDSRRNLHENICILNYTPRIQELYYQPQGMGLSIIYSLKVRTELYKYMKANKPPEQEEHITESSDELYGDELNSEEF